MGGSARHVTCLDIIAIIATRGILPKIRSMLLASKRGEKKVLILILIISICVQIGGARDWMGDVIWVHIIVNVDRLRCQETN